MATLADFHTAAAAELGLDTNSSLSGDDAARVTQLANRAVLDILIKTKCRVREMSLNLTAGKDAYSLDTDVLVMLELWASDANGNERVLEPMALDEINTRRLYGDLATPPVSYYTLQGSDLLIVFPTPDSGGTLKGQYVPRPTAMSAAGNDPSTTTYGGIPSEYHDLIEEYIFYYAARGDDHQGSARGNQYLARYLQRIQEMRRELLRKRGNRLPIARVGRRDRSRRFLTNDPSVGLL
jgi:hypothetical protein